MKHALQRIIVNYGFHSFGFLDLSHTQDEEPIYITTHDESWSKRYIDENFIEFDPCLEIATRRNSSFSWDEVAIENMPDSNKAKKVMDAAFDHGFSNGIVMPIHYKDPLSRSYSAVCTIFWTNTASEFTSVLAGHKLELDLILTFWTQKIVDIVSRERFRLSRHMQNDRVDSRSITLSGRERDVLNWASRGKTAAETAIILEISVETVTTHMKNALTKLSATNKVQGVSKAIYLGLIHP